MLAILSLAGAALLLARVAEAPRGTWRFVLGAAVVMIAASQLLPPGHPLRVDVGSWARWGGWGVVAAAPVVAYGLMIRRLRRGARPVPVAAAVPAHPVGLVRIAADEGLAAETRAALEREAGGEPPVSFGWRAEDGRMVGHLRSRRLAEVVMVEMIWVARDHRRQGIGAALLAAAEGAAGARRIAVETDGGGGLFVAAGYGIVFRHPLGPGVDRVWLEKELS